MIRKNRFSFFYILLSLSVLLSVFSFTALASAQNSGSTPEDILNFLREGAATEKSLGSFLWNQTSGSYTNLGEFASGELTSFLRKEVESNFSLDGKSAAIKIVSLGELSMDDIPVAEFGIELTQGENTENGTLKVNLNAIRNYVNKTLYPQMRSQLRGSVSDSVPLIKDLINLLAGSTITGNSIIPDMNAIWQELSNNMSSYPEIQKILQQPADEPLVTISTDDESEAANLHEIFDGIQSSKALADAFTQIDVNPTPDVELDIEPERDDHHHYYPEFIPLLNETLPATGFSASHFTALAERPKGLSYEITGLTLQIPELDVAETIVTVPLTDEGYPVDWINRNVGLLEGSEMPGRGITVLTGHNHLNNTEAGPFLFISTLETNDRLFITDADQTLKSFKVYGNYKIPTDGFSAISGFLKENTLVLITCEDESVDGEYINRRVIFAEPL